MQLKLTAVLLGAIALVAVPVITHGQSTPEMECPDEFDGIILSDRQKSQLQQLEIRLDNSIDEIIPISAESEAKIEALEENFDRQIEAIPSAQQQQQIEALDRWAEEQIAAIAPALLEDDEDDVMLTPQQESQLEALEEDYEQRFGTILTAEQQQRIEALEVQLDEAIEAELPQPTEEQETRIEAVEEEFEQRVMQILTADQRQQLQRNLACDESEI
ncbi:MAG: hypothetical protein AAF215_16475 [Cyanobacteria bacterium P01_A01_bin.123]